MRVDNWQWQLAVEITVWLHRPYRYGEADCFQFPASVVLALTGVDHRYLFPKYDSKESAEAIIAAHGGVAGIVTSVLGESKAPMQAAVGDVVVADFGIGLLAPGVCVGAQICGHGPQGLIFRTLDHSVAAWSV